MNKKHQLAAAIALTLGSVSAQAVETITVTTMEFYDANGNPGFFGGGLNTSVNGSVNSNNTGNIDSGPTPFFGTPWTASQQLWDNTPGAGKTWSGTSASGAFSYTYTLIENQVAVGLYFNWGAAVDIAVLQIFDCPNGTAGACVGVHNYGPDDYAGHTDHPSVPGSVMGNGPFAGQHATFKGPTAAAINADPVATDDTMSTPPGVPATKNVVTNDTDFEDGAPPVGATVNLVSTISTQSSVTNLVNNGDGTITYTPPGSLIAGNTDTFQYTLTDSGGEVSVAPATVTVTIGTNTAPDANNVDFSTNEDVALMIAISDTDDTGGDSIWTDADVGQTHTFATFDTATAQAGSVSVNGANTVLTYTPVANFNGTDTFNYTVSDGFDGSSPATMTITVLAQNDALTCADVELSTDPDVPLAINVASDLLSTCADIDGDTISLVSTTQPGLTGSTLADDGAGTLTYALAGGLTGKDSFDYTATDGTVTATATVNVAVGQLFDNFTMLDTNGDVFGGTNDVVFTWDGTTFNTDESDTTFGIMTIVSDGPHPFFGFPWTAHHVRVFGPGTYTFDTTCTAAQYDAGTTDCNGPFTDGQTERFMTMTVGAGQVGVHILFDWSVSSDIDVVNVWNQNATWDTLGATAPKNKLWVGLAGNAPDPTTTWELVSTDADGDGIVGSPMLDGPFIGFSANFNKGPAGSAAAPPPITTETIDTVLGNGALSWLTLLGVLPMLGLLRRRVKRQTIN